MVQSLVTGNLPVLADYKLAAFDLHHHIDFEIGGYGSLSEHRHDLVGGGHRPGVGQARRTFDSVVVIGDTPHDVAAGLHHGTTTVGVATGRFTVAELAESGAHVVLPDLADTPAVLDRAPALTVSSSPATPCDPARVGQAQRRGRPDRPRSGTSVRSTTRTTPGPPAGSSAELD